MSSAISIGTTGLTAASKQMDVIGNNLANADTLGFKSGSTYFSSMLTQSLSSGGSMQTGSGVACTSINTQFQQGSFQNTGNATDLAIDGEGFFMVKDKEGGQYYTRAGAFHVSEEGFLVDNNDYQVQGYNNSSDINGEDQLTGISLKNVQSSPKASTKTSMGINLDDTATYGDKFNVSQTVFDSKGKQHNLSTTFQKTEEAGVWGYTVSLDDTNISTGQSANGLVFDKNGALVNMYKGTMGTASTGPTALGTAANPGAATIDTGADISAIGTMVLTRQIDGTWALTNNGGYTNAAITEGAAGLVNVDLQGNGTSLHFTADPASGAWNPGDSLSIAMTTVGPAATVTATHRAVVAGTATGTLVKGGQIYQSTTSPIVLTETGNGSGVWTVTNNGGYDNITISTQEAGKIKVDLDGQGGTDLYFDISAMNTWKDGDTISFNLTKTDVATEDQILQFAALDNGATIGTYDTSTGKNKLTWGVVSDSTNKINGYASSSVVRSLSQDGYSSGTLKSMTIGGNGVITGFFTNGQTSNLGRILLASFPNSGGLKKVGNYFGATIESGEAIRNTAGTGGLGSIMSDTLEVSNTDTAKEFINMITAQRAYSSAAKVITTADQMTQELMNIKR
ncbi:MAG: hypothetical protein CSYNP_03939 [Syntrophus sp. SKADARSKE-3]|nr:hypothetical protein [Syntrophus sp. SKADARSKE-3]MDQ5988183.1 hypothetical protein [Syntrophus sp. SKADARSKE-3]